MSLRRFLVPPQNLNREVVPLPAAEAAHASKVLRLKPGDEVWLLDGEGNLARAVLETLERGAGSCRVLQRLSPAPPRPRLTVCPGLLKAAAMDLVITKLTELMADRIQPFVSERSVARFTGGEKVERWQRLAGQAIKQCGAPRLPRIDPPLDLADLLAAPGPEAARLLLYEDEGRATLAGALAAARQAPEVWLAVGPEGGFSPAEADLARRRGWTTCGLPGATLRAETASLVGAALVRLGDPDLPLKEG